MLESHIEGKLRRGVHALGGLSYKLVPVVAGLPDRLVLLPGGRVELVELKAADGKLRSDQLVIHEKFRKRGINVVVLTGPDEVERWLEKTKKEIENNG